MKITLTENDLWCSGPSIPNATKNRPSIFNFKNHIQDLFPKADVVEYVMSDGCVVVLKDRTPTQHTHRFTLEVDVVCPIGESPALTLTRQDVFNSLVDARYAVCDKNKPKALTASLVITKVSVIGNVC